MSTAESSNRLDTPAMTRRTIEPAQQTAARVAGLTYLFMTATVVFAFYSVRPRLIVAGNVAETAQNIMAHERLFRTMIACDLIYAVGVVVLLTMLYVILKPVNRLLALLGAFFRLVFGLMWLVIVLDLFDVLRLVTGMDSAQVFEAARWQALVSLRLGAGFDAYYVGLLFWGLASTVCSYLWFKSRYLPRALAGWGLISSFWCVVCAFTFIIFPDFGKAVNLYSFDVPIFIFEVATSVWLLFKGLRPPGIAEPAQVRG